MRSRRWRERVKVDWDRRKEKGMKKRERIGDGRWLGQFQTYCTYTNNKISVFPKNEPTPKITNGIQCFVHRATCYHTERWTDVFFVRVQGLERDHTGDGPSRWSLFPIKSQPRTYSTYNQHTWRDRISDAHVQRRDYTNGLLRSSI